MLGMISILRTEVRGPGASASVAVTSLGKWWDCAALSSLEMMDYGFLASALRISCQSFMRRGTSQVVGHGGRLHGSIDTTTVNFVGFEHEDRARNQCL